MKTTKNILLLALAIVMLGSCVSSKKYKAQTKWLESVNTSFAKSQADLNACENARALNKTQLDDLNKQMEDLKKQKEYLNTNNTQVLKQLENLSVISSSQAESIKKSMDNMGMKDAYIFDLQKSMAKKDSMNMALVLNLKGAVGSMDDKDINIKVDKGVIYIDISDKMLFKSGSYVITDNASNVLGKVAKVLKNQPNIEFMVEGHTDNVPYRKGDLLDNWDLSVKRATAVVRVLQNQYGLDPSKITAAGRSQYSPVTSNDNASGKSANRRTRIVILPQLDQFFKLLEQKKN